MQQGLRTRLFALTSVAMLALQFPVADVNVPIRYQTDTEASVPLSVMQVAVASYYQAGTKIPEPVLKAFLAPGMLAYDVFNEMQCKTGLNKALCDTPKALAQYADAFDLTEPLCNPKIIMGIVKRNFPKSTELMQAGSTVTVGSAIFSILYPIKIGFFGYLMIMFALFTEGITPAIPGLAFLPIFALATDIGSLMRPLQQKEKPATASAPEPKPAALTQNTTKEKKDKGANRKKKR